jgi:hypothetical protein
MPIEPCSAVKATGDDEATGLHGLARRRCAFGLPVNRHTAMGEVGERRNARDARRAGEVQADAVPQAGGVVGAPAIRAGYGGGVPGIEIVQRFQRDFERDGLARRDGGAAQRIDRRGHAAGAGGDFFAVHVDGGSEARAVQGEGGLRPVTCRELYRALVPEGSGRGFGRVLGEAGDGLGLRVLAADARLPGAIEREVGRLLGVRKAREEEEGERQAGV